MKHLLAFGEAIPQSEPSRIGRATVLDMTAKPIDSSRAIRVLDAETPENGGHQDKVAPVDELAVLRSILHEGLCAQFVLLVDRPGYPVLLLDALSPERKKLLLFSLVELLEGNIGGKPRGIAHSPCELRQSRVGVRRPEVGVGIRLYEQDGPLRQDGCAPAEPPHGDQSGASPRLVNELATDDILLAGSACTSSCRAILTLP
mmetsp:Transcript_15176/g.31764  ORF Transcript_15176/g.31764 Transcript_15176/m.31764 type:complete len:202 (-) Transcript_15176:22-627(-)